MNLFLSALEDLLLIKSTMAITSHALGSLFNLNKTDILLVGPPEMHDVSHSDILECFTGGYVVPQRSPLRVLGAWVGSPDCASNRWDQIYSHIKKIIRQWNAIGASLLNRALLAKALLLSRCYYLLDCNGIPSPILRKINNSICKFVRGPYSHMPYAFLSAPLTQGGLNCPSLMERKLAYDAKYISDLISLPHDIPWKQWTLTDLSNASYKPGGGPGFNINPLLQRSLVKQSLLEPRLMHAFVSCRTLRYDVSCAFPSMAARMDMPSSYHPAVPLRANKHSDELTRRHIRTVQHLTWPGTKLTRKNADPMPSRLKGILGSKAKAASQLYAANRASQKRRLLIPTSSDSSPDTSDLDPSESDGCPSPPLTQRPAAITPKPQPPTTTRLVIIKALSVTSWRNSAWWPDTSPKDKSIRIWPSMSNAYGCARILDSEQSLLARRDRAGNYSANRRFFKNYSPPLSLTLKRPRGAAARWEHVWTDGSALHNGSPYCIAGSAWASPDGRSQICHLSGPLLSNNIAELCAVYLAITAWQDDDLYIHTDSKYVLGLVNGGLLAMERDGWIGLPTYSLTEFSDHTSSEHLHSDLTELVESDSFSFGSLRPLFQTFLQTLRAHRRRLKFRWTKAHANDDMNNRVDTLAKQGLLPSSPLLDTTSLSPTPGWVDRGPVLNNQSLAFITDAVISASTIPFHSPKFLPFFSSWFNWMDIVFHSKLDPTHFIPSLWKINIPVGLRELLYKHISSSLPLGKSWHGKLRLGQTCRCGADMSLDHIWESCPSYDLKPLLLILYSHFIQLHRGDGLSTKPWKWPNPIWYPILSFKVLDNHPSTPTKLRRQIGKSRSKREWAIGAYVWFIWKQRMKEVHDTTYKFIPELHCDALSSYLADDNN